MVARAVPRLGGRVPVCTGRPLLEAANAAHLNGQTVLAAVRLREAIRRYLVANCEHEGIDLPSCKRRTPMVLVRHQRRHGVSISTWLDEVLGSIEQILRCEPPTCSMSACLMVSFDLFGNLFTREG